MNERLLSRLSNADAIASKEWEVRDILQEELASSCDDLQYDQLGSVIFHRSGQSADGPKLMFSAHMDEVGFLVRHISDIGFLYLISVGGVLDKSKEMQRVRITTQENTKVYGLLNVTKTASGQVDEQYVDVGCQTKAEVEALGIQIGDMVCFDSTCKKLNNLPIYAGKAMDDRAGCYVICEAMKQLQNIEHESDVYMCASSSEEVGIRGAKCATYQIDPDIVFAIDVANHPELSRNYTNHRNIGSGCMLIHYDKTMAPNTKLLQFVKEVADAHHITYQCDMFSGGGTDAGKAHLDRNGKLAIVIGIPLRYCHGAWSYVHEKDLESTIQLLVELVKRIKKTDVQYMLDFNRRK